MQALDGWQWDEENEKVGDHVGDGADEEDGQHGLAVALARGGQIPELLGRYADKGERHDTGGTPGDEEDERGGGCDAHHSRYKNAAVHQCDGDFDKHKCRVEDKHASPESLWFVPPVSLVG